MSTFHIFPDNSRFVSGGCGAAIAALYDYWILGRNAVQHEPRWSVLRNVLHLGK